MAKALNLKVKDEIYKLLQDATSEKGQSKTRIVEDALQAYLSDNVDDSTSNNVDNVDSNLHRENSIQQNVDLSTLSSENQTQQDLEARIERLEKRESENYDAIARLQNTYPEYVEQTKQLKEDVRELKNETQKLKNSKASMNDIRNLETVLEKKIDQHQLDERLAMATMPIWGEIDSDVQNRDRENIPSKMPLESKREDKPYQLSFTEDKPPEEAKTDQSENKTQKADNEGITATELAGVLEIPKTYITKWKKGKNIPSNSSKYHSAYQEWVNWELRGGRWQKKPAS